MFLRIILILLTIESNVFSSSQREDKIQVKFWSVTAIEYKNILKNLLHDEECDDIYPRISSDATFLLFERVPKTYQLQHNIYCLSLYDVNYALKNLKKEEEEEEVSISEDYYYPEDIDLYFGIDKGEFISSLAFSPKEDSNEFVFNSQYDIYLGKCKFFSELHLDEYGRLTERRSPKIEELTKELIVKLYKLKKGNYALVYSVVDDKKYLLRGASLEELSFKDNKEFKHINKEDMEPVVNRYMNLSRDNLVFVSNLTGGGDIYILPYDFSIKNLKRITFNEDIDTFPQISKDGKRIVFCSRVEKNIELFLYNLQERRLTEIITTQKDKLYPKLNPTFSPNNQYIAYYILRNKGEETEKIYDIHVFDLSTKKYKIIAKDVLRNERYGVCWLPGEFGNKIIYTSCVGDALYITDIDTEKTIIVDTFEDVFADEEFIRFLKEYLSESITNGKEIVNIIFAHINPSLMKDLLRNLKENIRTKLKSKDQKEEVLKNLYSLINKIKGNRIISNIDCVLLSKEKKELLVVYSAVDEACRKRIYLRRLRWLL